MSAQHTPGPWEARIWNGEEWPEKRWSVGRVDDLGTCVCISPRYADPTDLTDARLIAAAPELLDALREAWEWIDNWSPPFTEDDEWPSTAEKIKAAIAKAEGQP